jgi:hypothetical protein
MSGTCNITTRSRCLAPPSPITWPGGAWWCLPPEPPHHLRQGGAIPADDEEKSRRSTRRGARYGLADPLLFGRGGRHVAASQCGCCAPPLTAGGSRWQLLLLSRLLSAF